MTPIQIDTSKPPSTKQSNNNVSVTPETAEPLFEHQDVTLKLILVRHAESTLNALTPRVVQGQSDSPLTLLGQKQAYFLAHRLSKQRVNCIYSSDLKRAVQTAKVIADLHHKRVLEDSRLREQCLGNLTGKVWGDVKKMLKKLDHSWESYLSSHSDCETTQALKMRLIEFYVDLVEKHILQPFSIRFPENPSDRSNKLISKTGPLTPFTPNSRPINACIVVVTHGGPILQLLKHFQKDLGFPIPSDITHPYAFPKSTALYEIVLERRFRFKKNEFDWKGNIHLLNCVSHLAGIENYSMLAAEPTAAPAEENAPTYVLKKQKKEKKVTKMEPPAFFNLEEGAFEKRIKSLGW